MSARYFVFEPCGEIVVPHFVHSVRISMILLAGILDLAGHTPAFRTNHPHAIKSADGKGDWKFSTRTNYALTRGRR